MLRAGYGRHQAHRPLAASSRGSPGWGISGEPASRPVAHHRPPAPGTFLVPGTGEAGQPFFCHRPLRGCCDSYVIQLFDHLLKRKYKEKSTQISIPQSCEVLMRLRASQHPDSFFIGSSSPSGYSESATRQLCYVRHDTMKGEKNVMQDAQQKSEPREVEVPTYHDDRDALGERAQQKP